MQAQQQNIEPNRYSDDFDLSQLIRQNMDLQHQERIKNTLMKQSLVKLSLDKDFQHMYKLDGEQPKSNESESGLGDNQNNSIIEVSREVKQICQWLQESEEFKGMAYLPFAYLPKIFHILHQKIENTIIIVTDYHSYWLERMQDMNRLSVMKWAFLNTRFSKEEKIKILELYQMKKTKLLFISPSIFHHEQYLEFQSDILVIPDLHLYANSKNFIDKIVQKCSPGRVLGIHSNPMKNIGKRLNLGMQQINTPSYEQQKSAPIMIALKCQSQNDEKFKNLLAYLQKNQQLKHTLILVNNRSEAATLSKKLKLKSLTSFNLFDFLTTEEMNFFTSQQILQRTYKNSTNGDATQDKIMETMYRSKNYNVTIGKYFDALRFANFDSVIFYDFVDVPRFVTSCADVRHRVILLADDDYFTFRNQITKNIFPHENLARITLKIMEKPRKRDEATRKRFYSEFIQSNALLSCYSVTKQAIKKNEQKVLRLNNFCKTYEITIKSLYQIIQCLCSIGVLQKICKLAYEIQINEEHLQRFRDQYPEAIQIRSKVSLLGLATSLKLTTNQTLQEISSRGISYRITEEALQLRILREYSQINFEELVELVNENIMIKVRQFDDSYVLYKDLSYSSVELTRREKFLNRWKKLVEFYSPKMAPKPLLDSVLVNIFDSSHKSNLLTSEIEEWIRSREEQTNLDEHELIMLLQGVSYKKLMKFKEDPIVGRYKRIRYQDLAKAIEKIYKNKKVKTA